MKNDNVIAERRNIARRSFKKSFVDYDNRFNMKKIEAEYKNGLLRIYIPLKKDEEEFKIRIA